MQSRIVVCVPKQHKSIITAIDKIADRQGLTPSKVSLAILINFLKNTNQIKTVSYYKKRKYIKKIITDYKQSASSKLTTI